MTITQIYQHYGIPTNLQLHMLRVAALANKIIQNRKKPIHSEEIIQVCLLHDIAKPIDIDLSKQSPFMRSDEELQKLKKTQEWMKKNFGSHEHFATLSISRELGLNDCALSIMESCEWNVLRQLVNNNKIEHIIPIYCDMRIGPKGILSLEQRMNDLCSRKPVSQSETLLKAGQDAELLLQKYARISLPNIEHQQIEQLAEELRSYTLMRQI